MLDQLPAGRLLHCFTVSLSLLELSPSKSIASLGLVLLNAMLTPAVNRNVLICLSPRGREAIDAIINELNASDLVLSMQLAQEERETLAHLLRKLLLLLEHRIAGL